MSDQGQIIGGFPLFALLLAALAATVLLIAGARLATRAIDPTEKRRGWLMIAAALVTAMNVAIWLV